MEKKTRREFLKTAAIGAAALSASAGLPESGQAQEKKILSRMKIITIADIPGKVPAKHYDLLGHPIVDESTGIKNFRVSFTRMEKTGRADPHIHENAEQLFIVLKGAMGFRCKEGDFLLKAGQAVIAYRGELHSNYNKAPDGETEYLTVTG